MNDDLDNFIPKGNNDEKILVFCASYLPTNLIS